MYSVSAATSVGAIVRNFFNFREAYEAANGFFASGFRSVRILNSYGRELTVGELQKAIHEL